MRMILVLVALSACAPAVVKWEANQASQFCQSSGGEIQLEVQEGKEVGMCHLSDGRVVEEWTFYNGQNI